MKTTLKLVDNSTLRVRAKHQRYGQEFREIWIVEMRFGRNWTMLSDPSQTNHGFHATRQEAEAALELHREALNAVNES